MIFLMLTIFYLWYVVKIVREERARKWAYEHRDPDDKYWWGVDEWANFYYENPDEPLQRY